MDTAYCVVALLCSDRRGRRQGPTSQCPLKAPGTGSTYRYCFASVALHAASTCYIIRTWRTPFKALLLEESHSSIQLNKESTTNSQSQIDPALHTDGPKREERSKYVRKEVHTLTWAEGVRTNGTHRAHAAHVTGPVRAGNKLIHMHQIGAAGT